MKNYKNISILAFNGATASSITAPVDMFRAAGTFWNTLNGRQPQNHFQVQIVSHDGKLVRCFHDVLIQPHKSIQDVKQTDLILIAGISDNIDKVLNEQKAVIPWLKKHHNKGTIIASVCTGSFLLAQTGLLDGKSATTHWGYAKAFQKYFPSVQLQPDRLITDEGNILCAGGASSVFELSLYLIQRYCGQEIAVQCSKTILIDRNRTSQVPYTLLMGQRNHNDRVIAAIQDWLESNYSKNISIDGIAEKFAMSPRNFKRRFKNATGQTPITSLQYLRIEAAKRFLEETQTAVDEITYQIGYEDVSFFRKLFKRHTNLTPQEYRKKFQGMWAH